MTLMEHGFMWLFSHSGIKLSNFEVSDHVLKIQFVWWMLVFKKKKRSTDINIDIFENPFQIRKRIKNEYRKKKLANCIYVTNKKKFRHNFRIAPLLTIRRYKYKTNKIQKQKFENP